MCRRIPGPARFTSTTFQSSNRGPAGPVGTNSLAVKEQIARTKILETLHDGLFSTAGIAYARKRIAERLGGWARERNTEISERRGRLERTEARIAGLIQFIADGFAGPMYFDDVQIAPP